MQQPAQLEQSYPSKKRGILWLISSLVVLGVAGFFAFIYWLQLVLRLAKGAFTFFLNPDVMKNADSDFYIFLISIGVSLFAYIGVWYGTMLITASYKNYSFTKTRLLALVVSLGSIAIVLLVFNLK